MTDELNIETPQAEAQVEVSQITDEANEPSLVDKIYHGEVNFRELDGATRKTVLKEVYNNLDERKKFLWDNGWRDQPFFLGKNRNGDEITWKDADEFEKTLKVPQVKKERENHLIDELKKRDAEIEKLKKATHSNFDYTIKKDEASIEARIAKAKAEFDTDALYEAMNEREQLRLRKEEAKQYYEAPVQNSTPNPQDAINQLLPEDREALLDFDRNNPWYKADPTMAQYAINEMNQTHQLQPHLSFRDKLEFVRRRTMAAFPSKFQTKPTNFMPTTNTVNNQPLKTNPATKNAETVYNNLSQRDKDKLNNQVAAGKIPNREAGLKKYGLI